MEFSLDEIYNSIPTETSIALLQQYVIDSYNISIDVRNVNIAGYPNFLGFDSKSGTVHYLVVESYFTAETTVLPPNIIDLATVKRIEVIALATVYDSEKPSFIPDGVDYTFKKIGRDIFNKKQ